MRWGDCVMRVWIECGCGIGEVVGSGVRDWDKAGEG